MDVFIYNIEKESNNFYTKFLKPLIPIMEQKLLNSAKGNLLCNDPSILEEYQRMYKIDPNNQKGIVSIDQIVRQLFSEKRTSIKKNSSRSFEETIRTVREKEINTGVGNGKRRVYVNFIYGIPFGTNTPVFRFGRISKTEYEGNLLLTEDGGKHIQLCRNHKLLYAGTMIFTRSSESEVRVVINPNSGRWLELMNDLIYNHMTDQYWMSVFGSTSVFPKDKTKKLKMDILNTLMIKRVEELLLSDVLLPEVDFVFQDCHHTFLNDFYNHVMLDEKCRLDIGVFIKKMREKEKEKNKRKR